MNTAVVAGETDERARKRRNGIRWVVGICTAVALGIYVWVYLQGMLTS